MGRYRKVEQVNYWKGMTPMEKVDYFFQYYFWKVVVIIVAAVLVGLGIYQIATNYKGDYEVLFVSDEYMMDADVKKIEEEFHALAEDNNGDGQMLCEFVPLIFYTNSEIDMNEYNLSLQQKLVAVLATGEPRILICSKTEMEYLVGMGLLQVSLPKGVAASAENENSVYFSQTTLADNVAFEDVPDDYLVSMVEMGARVRKSEKNLSKRDYTYEVFTSLITK